MSLAGLFKWTVFLLAIPAVLLLAVASLIIFYVFGGGWAYGTAGVGCHFEMNPFGLAMVAAAALGPVIFLYAVGRRLIRTNKKVLSPR
jgi:hypothetical protein